MGAALDKDRLIREAAAFGVAVDDGMAQRFSLYADLLIEWNARMNLTAITDPEGILYKHFLDSIAAAACLPAGALRLIDVGSGAGFPGVPLAIVRPDIELTLLDSLGKRLTFLQALCEYCLPFVRPGGRFLALKGPDGEAELAAAAKAIDTLGGKPEKTHTFILPGGPQGEPAHRRILCIKKGTTTPPKYPRPSAKIAKQPL